MSEWDWDHWDHLSQAVRSPLVAVWMVFALNEQETISVSFQGGTDLGGILIGRMMKPTHRHIFVRDT